MAVQDPKYPVKLPVTFAGLYGAILLACLINLVFYGIGVLRVLQYYKRHASKDSVWLKGTVVILILLATLVSAFSSHQVYDMFITRLGKPALLDTIVFSVSGEYMCVYLTAFVAQICFASRIWSIGRGIGTRHYWFTIPVVVLALMQVSAGLAQVSVMGMSKTYSRLTLRTGLLLEATAIQGTASALSDIFISSTLCSIFNSQRSGIRRADSVIDKLTTYAINRAVATSFCAVMSVILYYFCSGTYYFMIPFLTQSQFYVISVISILTSRDSIASLRKRADGGITSDMEASKPGMAEADDYESKSGSF